MYGKDKKFDRKNAVHYLLCLIYACANQSKGTFNSFRKFEVFVLNYSVKQGGKHYSLLNNR